jgi:hypothetical protein
MALTNLKKRFWWLLPGSFLIAGLGVLLYDRSEVILWAGVVDLNIEFVVTAAGDGQPIKAAAVAIDTSADETERSFSLQTNPNGRARRDLRLTTSGRLSRLGFINTYGVNLPYWHFQVSAPGYTPSAQTALHSTENSNRVKRLEPGRAELVIPVALRRNKEGG